MNQIRYLVLTLAFAGFVDAGAEQLTVREILTGYQQGRFSAEQVVRDYLALIERHEAELNAFTFLNPDAIADAREIDRRRAAGESVGPLAGVPLVIKESMDVVGYPSTMGWAPTSARAGGQDFMPRRNAAVVQRLIDAGAIILGKTNIPPFSDSNTRTTGSWDGETYNAIDKTIAPGGSSSGTATAVAAGYAPAGLAEESGGSIQSPAASQSLVGIVPTFSLVPNTGVAPLGGDTLDVMGPIATNICDAALILDVIAGTDANDPKTLHSDDRVPPGGYTSLLSESALSGKRLGLYGRGFNVGELSAETVSLYRRAIRELEGRGATMVADPFEGSGFAELERLSPDGYDVRGYEVIPYALGVYLHGLGVDSLREFIELVGVDPFAESGPLQWYTSIPGSSEILREPGKKPNLEEFVALRQQYREIFDAILSEHDIDAMVFPHARDALPALESEENIGETTVETINIGGLPVVTVPAGRYPSNGSPFGLVFVGRPFSEAELLALAYDYEQSTQHRIVPDLGNRLR